MEVLIDTGRSRLLYYPSFAPDLYSEVVNVPVLVKPVAKVWGREVHQQRDIAFLSDVAHGYRYSKQTIAAIPLDTSPSAREILTKVNETLNVEFNAILHNRYTTGTDYCGAHSDAMDVLSNSTVAAICWGPGVRTFRVRDKGTGKIRLDVQHESCAMLVMEGDFQQEFTHEIPIQKRVTGERISWTFRQHSSDS